MTPDRSVNGPGKFPHDAPLRSGDNPSVWNNPISAGKAFFLRENDFSAPDE